MNEASGTRNDSHGTNHLTDNNTVGVIASPFNKEGANGALFVTANAESLSVANNASLQWGAGSGAISLHVLFTTLAFSHVIMAKASLAAQEFQIDLDNGFRFFLQNAAGGIITHPTAAAQETWYHIVAQRNADTAKLELYVNGSTRSG